MVSTTDATFNLFKVQFNSFRRRVFQIFSLSLSVVLESYWDFEQVGLSFEQLSHFAEWYMVTIVKVDTDFECFFDGVVH